MPTARSAPGDWDGNAPHLPSASRPAAGAEVSAAEVLRSVDASMFMRSGDWLQAAMAEGRKLVVIDLRARGAYEKGHIPGSVHITLNGLPDAAASLPPRTHEVICVCNGSVQSAMAVVFLRTLGYQNAFNLSGGLSAWERQGRRLETSLR
jgi:rhodanese-related sulfurtransferase